MTGAIICRNLSVDKVHYTAETAETTSTPSKRAAPPEASGSKQQAVTPDSGVKRPKLDEGIDEGDDDDQVHGSPAHPCPHPNPIMRGKRAGYARLPY